MKTRLNMSRENEVYLEGHVGLNCHLFRISGRVNIHFAWLLKNMRTKQTARKIQEMERATFPEKGKEKEKEKGRKKDKSQPVAGTSGSTQSPGRLTLGSMEMDSGDSQTWLNPETLMLSQSVQQLEKVVTLPKQVAIGGMHPSFIKYFREHGMTLVLMHGLMTK